jgi:hypothetical protein
MSFRLDSGRIDAHNPHDMTDFPEPPSPSPERRQARREYERTPDKAGPALTAIGGGIVILGSFMPWATVSSGFATASISGTEGDGKITMVLGLALVILGVIELTRVTSLRVLILIAATLAAGIGVVDLVSARERVAGVASALLHASVGVGLYAVVGGGILAIVGGLFNRYREPERSPRF